jgi:hypothetical protein
VSPWEYGVNFAATRLRFPPKPRDLSSFGRVHASSRMGKHFAQPLFGLTPGNAVAPGAAALRPT